MPSPKNSASRAVAGKRKRKVDTFDPTVPLPNANDELFCQLRFQGNAWRECQTATEELPDDASVAMVNMRGLRRSALPHIKARIDYLFAEDLRIKQELCAKFEVNREAVIANAVIGYELAHRNGDVAGMNAHNRAMAEFARDAYWADTLKVKIDGFDELLADIWRGQGSLSSESAGDSEKGEGEGS